jgi:hypothetical protein
MARRKRAEQGRVDEEFGLAELDQRVSHSHCDGLRCMELVVCVCGLADCEFGLVVLGEREGLPYFCRGSGSWFPFPRRSRFVSQVWFRYCCLPSLLLLCLLTC